MKSAVLSMLVLVGCAENEPPTPKCQAALEHIVSISPRGQGKDPKAVVAALPVEDLIGCKATEPEIVDCMLRSPDTATVKKCVPSGEILGCMRTAAAAKKLAHEKAKKTEADPALDKPFDDVRAKCWGGDAKAADGLRSSL